MSTDTLSGSVRIDPARGWMPYNRMIFGQFLEHFHRVIYDGVFEPGSPLADEKGFRLDVVNALRELRVPVVRWPGGCFVSAYHWVDGIGPNRQPSYDKAWMVEEPNLFGTDEFITWCQMIGAEPYICTNAGSGSPEEMSDWVEYCNLASAGKWARLRQSNGFPQPHNVRWWSIGNENYGDWEMGAKTAGEWGDFVAGYEGKIGIAFDEWNLRGWHHPFQGTPEAIGERKLNDLSSSIRWRTRSFPAPSSTPACAMPARSKWPTWPRWSTRADRCTSIRAGW